MTSLRCWREQLLHRRYPFPASGHKNGDLAVRIEHGGAGYFFPLGTAEPKTAAKRAQGIHQKVLDKGWEWVCRNYPRELVVGFEWCAHPLMWTYTTIHTLVGRSRPKQPALPRGKAGSRVLVVERDPGIRAALSWCINQHPGFVAAPCEAAKGFGTAVDFHQPCLVLMNRNIAEELGLQNPGQIGPMRPGLPALAYSLCSNGDELFVSTPGGSPGYFLKRVRPELLLEPVLQVSARGVVVAEDLNASVKKYFKEVLRPGAGEDAPGMEKLTRREREVLVQLSRGCVDKEIAQVLGISPWTVHGHIKNIFERLQVRTRTEAVVRYLEK